MSSHTIVLASRNRKKTKEVTEILAAVGFSVIPVTNFPDVPDVEEDGQTFAENAAKKASQVARQLKQWVIGEDSGLIVDALNGAPGIYSARYSGLGIPTKKTMQNCLRTSPAYLTKNVEQAIFVVWPYPIPMAKFGLLVKAPVAGESCMRQMAREGSVTIRIF